MRKRHSILCVDADGFGLQVRRLVLETAGYRVFAFTRPEEAFRALLDHPIDAVLLDQALEIDQPGTARSMKALQPDIPVLMLSAGHYPPSSAKAYVDSHVTKGESPESLLAEINHVVRKRPSHSHRLSPLIWASGAVATGAAWFAARALHRRLHRNDSASMKRPPTSEKPQVTGKSASA